MVLTRSIPITLRLSSHLTASSLRIVRNTPAGLDKRLMSTSTDAVVERLFSRDLPPLEPGTKVWAPDLTKAIKDLDEHRFTKAG